LGAIDFELDFKMVVDSFSSLNHEDNEFGVIISHCKSIYVQYCRNSSVEFVRRQTKRCYLSIT